MGETSKIEWTDATVNFWHGCTKVGPACDHCYAESMSRRFGPSHWGVGVPRRKIAGAPAMIRKLAAKRPGARVFIQSMSDLFDNEVPLEWFNEAWAEIEDANTLRIQIVTKRVSIVEKRLAAIGVKTWPKHAGLMISVCDQDEADRDVPRLLLLKSTVPIPWVGISAEPLLGPIDFTKTRFGWSGTGLRGNALTGFGHPNAAGFAVKHQRLDWIIVGGESGPGARPMHPDWARSIRDQCVAAGVPFLFKQWGEWADAEDWQSELQESLEIEGKADGNNVRVGKRAAGRRLDGRTHDEFPNQVRDEALEERA